MRIFILLLFTIAFSAPTFSQSRYSFIDFKDGKQPGIVSDYNYSDKTVTDAIDSRLEKLGYKGKESKGYVVYRGVTLPELGPGVYDLHIKVDRRSRKEKDASHLTMLVSKGNETFVSDLDDAALINNAKGWLDKMDSSIMAYDLEQQVKDQEELVQKAEKVYRNLVDDGDDLHKKKKRIEEQIQDNIKDQQNQRNEIEKQKQVYEALKAKRRI